MKLNVLLGESRFIASPGRPDAPLMLPPIEFGNVRPIDLRVYAKGANGIYAVDVDNYEITLLVGPPNTRPALGFWQLTTSQSISHPIAVRASNQEVVDALAPAFGDVEVEGGNGSYIVTLQTSGVWALPTATFQGNTLSNVLVFEITPGTVSSPAQYRIEILEVAPARIVPANWTAGNTTPTNSFTQIDGLLWELVLDPLAESGFFTLTIDGDTSTFISRFANAYDLQVALNLLNKPAQVQTNGTGGFLIVFDSAVTTASVGGNLIIQPFQLGNLDLTSSGVRELLDGLQFTSVKLSVILVAAGKTVTVATADVVLQMPVNQPTTITIDAPQMAGLTFAISGDGAWMHVYVNGTLTYDIPLNAPTGDNTAQQLQLAFAANTAGSAIQVFGDGSHSGDIPVV